MLVIGNLKKFPLRPAIIFNIAWIVVCLFTISFYGTIHIEFTNSGANKFAILLFYLSFFISLIWTSKELLNIRSPWFAAILTLISLAILAVVFLSQSICQSSDKVIFRNLYERSFIIEREYGCGAFDSQPPEVSYYLVSPWGSKIHFLRRIDNLKIDTSNWTPSN